MDEKDQPQLVGEVFPAVLERLREAERSRFPDRSERSKAAAERYIASLRPGVA